MPAIRFGDGSALWNPIRTADHLSFVQEEVAIVRECEPGKTKAPTGTEPIRPFHQYPLEVVLNERMLQHVPSSVSDQSCLRYRVFVRGVVRIGFFTGLQKSLTLLRTQQLEQLREVVRLKRLPHFLDLAESVRFDFQFNRVLRGMFQQGVTRIEFELAGDIPNTDDHGATGGVCLTISHN